MTGRSELAPKYSIVGPDGTLVTQYMCYANVYCVVAGEAGRKLEIVVYGKAVLGGTEEAMVGLAGVVEVSGEMGKWLVWKLRCGRIGLMRCMGLVG
jgi:hypothetical protein